MKQEHPPRFFSTPVTPSIPVDLASLPLYRASNFPAAGPTPWLDRPDALEQIEHRLAAGELTPAEAELCRKWVADGYVILEGFYSRELIDRTWAQYEAAITQGTVVPPHEPLFDGDTLPGRVANAHFAVEAVDRMLFEPRMSEVISLLMGVKALPFQTIIGHKSSQQLEHSDSIHMTTYPLGYLAANWIAFEDIHPDSGPLVYYPGSHCLPYLFSDALGIPPETGYGAYRSTYEPAIQKLIAEHRLQPKIFTPKKGDVLVWHANLLHGGTRINGTANPSRKALVCHFFAEGCVCYHDLTGTLSHNQLGHNLYTYTPETTATKPAPAATAKPETMAAPASATELPAAPPHPAPAAAGDTSLLAKAGRAYREGGLLHLLGKAAGYLTRRI